MRHNDRAGIHSALRSATLPVSRPASSVSVLANNEVQREIDKTVEVNSQ